MLAKYLLRSGVSHTVGKQSLSKTNAWRSCPQLRGITIQLPHHQGRSHLLPFFPHIHPSSSAILYANSAAWLNAYIAIVIRSWSLGYTASINPARLAPIAGARLDVNVLVVRLFLCLKGCASGVRRCALRRVKNRKRIRWKRRIVERERDRRKFGDFHRGSFFSLKTN